MSYITGKFPQVFFLLIILLFRNLRQYLKLGLKLTKVRRVLRFNQSEWLRPYIEKNTRLRQQAKNPFEVALAKLMVISEFDS